MKFRKEKNCFIVKLEPGDEAIASLKKFCGDHAIKGGFVCGIGGASECVLGAFDGKTKRYEEKTFKGNFIEILSLAGDVTETGPHLHAVIGGHDFACNGGHVISMTVGVTAEIFLFPCEAIPRELDERFNLKLMKL